MAYIIASKEKLKLSNKLQANSYKKRRQYALYSVIIILIALNVCQLIGR